MTQYAKKNLNEIEDSAVKHGFSETQMARFAGEVKHGFSETQIARFAGKELGCESIGLALEGVKPGRRQAFGHKHEQDEEVYVIFKGSGRMRLGDEVIEVGELDAIRVAPGLMRAFEAGDEGLQILAFGTHHEGDGEIDPGFWPE